MKIIDQIGQQGRPSPQFEPGKLLGLVASVFGVQQLGEEEFAQLWAFAHDGRVGQRRPEKVDAVASRDRDAVTNIGCARVDGLHYNEGVQKVRGDHVRCKGRVVFLEHHGDYVVSYKGKNQENKKSGNG